VMMAGFEFDDAAPDSVNEGDAGAARMSANRSIYVNLRDNAGNERGLNVDANGALAATVTNATASNLNAQVVGTVAHDSADSGNPVKIGAFGETSISGRTMATDGDRVDLVAGVDGVLVVRPNTNLEDLVSGTASNTDGTSTQVLAAGAAGIKHYITDVTLVNTSASNIYVELKDNATAKWVFPVPAGGGVTHHFSSPLAGTAATAWNFDPSAATTTVYCSVSGFKSKL
jgi:hypothetical protein